ncbi:recombinase family protein [Brevibacterium moorei]|uniref:recombinase family protein n=1 Tax=Brevibacterium moorei TaxID=2968457 RepID=UPI00211C5B99|nr:recombinase family protein [Brevibacterium sp. 68QC2CO]MCQ9386072.1 recombinase family protein [Brevibacterium sp. 68QC2CO]
MTYKIGYARVSTKGQSTKVQEEQLCKAGCDEVISDQAVSGAKNHKSPKYRHLFELAQERLDEDEAVEVIVVKLDRFGRSTKSVLDGLERLARMGASFRTLDGGLKYELGNAYDELVVTIFAGLAKFERDLITSRMSEGRAAKVEKGLRLGPKPQLSNRQVKAIRDDYKDGATDRRIAKDWKVSRTTVDRVLGIYG